MNTKKKKKQNQDVAGKQYGPVDVVNRLYLFFMAFIFPLYMDYNKSDSLYYYFNITATKAEAFLYASLGYILLAAAALLIEYQLRSYYGQKDIFERYRRKPLAGLPELWMLLFALANVFAWMVADNHGQAFSGEAGRRFGCAMVLVICFMFLFLAKSCRIPQGIFVAGLLASGGAFLIAILQHLNGDFLGLRDRVAEKQKEMFISTFGNINTFGSYICLALPVFLAVFIFAERLWVRILSGVGIIMGSLAIMTAKSDNVYIGLAAAVIFLFYLAVHNQHIGRYFSALFMMTLGLFAMSVLNEIFHGSTKHLNGVAALIGNKKIMGGLMGLLLIICLLFLVLKKWRPAYYKGLQCKAFLIGVTVLGCLAVGGVIWYGVRTKNELFVFNDEWGTYRGYIWRKSVELFRKAPLLNKIFGYGNESVSALMKANFYDEMLEITNRTYDNCHNELLQYLVTTGILGAVAYVGVFLSSVIYMLKNGKGRPEVIACAAGCVAYLAQAMVNLNQPITTPIYFVMLAAGVGAARFFTENQAEVEKL